MKNSLRRTWLQYEAGKDYKRRIGLYQTVRQNERFYRGDQWYMIPAGNLPRPVFNVIRRVVDYLVCEVTPERIFIKYVDEKQPYLSSGEGDRCLRVSRILGANARYRWEKSGMAEKLFRLVSDAAISGDGVLYCYWKASENGDGSYEGEIETDVIDNVNLFLSDVNKRDIQSQEYIILSGRASVASLRKEARANGVDEQNVQRIVADACDERERAGDHYGFELEGEDEEKATYLIKFWREDGKVCFEKSTRECVINRMRTPCTLYPVTYFNWYPTKNCCHGTSVVSGMIANQKYINRAYAMVMKHMSDTAFSKVIYDKSRIPEWSNEVGEAIAALGGTNVSDAVSVLGVGELQKDYLSFLNNVISNTKELSGATEASLGNIDPENTSAILAVQEASKLSLKLVRSALYRCIVELAEIWADMVLSYFACERLVPMLEESGRYCSEPLGITVDEGLKPRACVEVLDTSSLNASVTVSILDKLLSGGYITLDQYLSRIPSGYVKDCEGLIGGERDE